MIRPVIALARGLVHRWGSTLLILAVAVVAAATAAMGPTYYQAAQRSVLRDVLSAAPVIGRGYEATASGPVGSPVSLLTAKVDGTLDRDLGAGLAARVFARPVDTIETSEIVGTSSLSLPLVWRTGLCSHLAITGRCPVAADQVVVSRADAELSGWHVGGHLPRNGWLPELTITGIYQSPRLTDDYWVLHATTFFPREDPVSQPPGYDAAFTSLATMTRAPAEVQGSTVVDVEAVPHQVSVTAAGRLKTGLASFVNDPGLSAAQVVITSTLPATLAGAQHQWRALAAPITVTTVTMLLLSLLLLFLIVTEAVEARGGDIALAKLRGHRRLGVLVFGLSEQAVILTVALPAGIALGWAGAAALARALLVPGTAVSLPPAAIAAAVISIAGGLTALILAARRALRRGVLEQLRRTGQHVRPGWTMDAVLLTGSAAGLVEVLTTRSAGTASGGWLELLVPGLLGLAVAVVASRLLPVACRALYGRTSRRGGLAGFLAIRHIARRDGGVRTTMVLAAAFSLAAFAFASWAVGQRNYQRVAQAEVGASEVLTVRVPAGRDLATIVARADPSGRRATAVETYVGLNGASVGQTTLAVDPARFARIASWPAQVTAADVTTLTRALHPRATPAVVLDGDAMRVTVRVRSLSTPGEQMYANVTKGSTPVQLGALPGHGTVTLTGPLTGCPCLLQGLALTAANARILNGQSMLRLSASLLLTALQVRQHGRWAPAVPQQALASAAHWRDETAGVESSARPVIETGSAGLTWTIKALPGQFDAVLSPADFPEPMPALVAAPLVRGAQRLVSGNGLDGSPLAMRIAGVLPYVPSAPANGAIVDRSYAELAAAQNLSAVAQQVWLAPGALPAVEPRLAGAGVKIESVGSTAATVARLSRQGPALASALFLADAAAVAFLAAAAAVVGLYASARRRQYEYAAMEATGVRRRDLRVSLLLEVSVALGYGAAVGTLTGMLAAKLVLGHVPEFTSPPAVPVLSYAPPAVPMAALLGAMAAALVVTAVASSTTLIGGTSSDVLRESTL